MIRTNYDPEAGVLHVASIGAKSPWTAGTSATSGRPAAACGPPVISPGRARKPVSAWGFGGDRFTAGDLMMTTVLRITDGKGCSTGI